MYKALGEVVIEMMNQARNDLEIELVVNQGADPKTVKKIMKIGMINGVISSAGMTNQQKEDYVLSNLDDINKYLKEVQ